MCLARAPHREPSIGARRNITGAGAVNGGSAEIGTDVAVGGDAALGGRADAAGMRAATVEAGDLAAATLAVTAELVVGAAVTDRLAADRVNLGMPVAHRARSPEPERDA